MKFVMDRFDCAAILDSVVTPWEVIQAPKDQRELDKIVEESRGKKFGYHGNRCPDYIPVCFFEGWYDATVMHRFDSLYRRPLWKKVGYWLGWHVRRSFGQRS
jgi:hypothetical protein